MEQQEKATEVIERAIRIEQNAWTGPHDNGQSRQWWEGYRAALADVLEPWELPDTRLAYPDDTGQPCTA